MPSPLVVSHVVSAHFHYENMRERRKKVEFVCTQSCPPETTSHANYDKHSHKSQFCTLHLFQWDKVGVQHSRKRHRPSLCHRSWWWMQWLHEGLIGREEPLLRVLVESSAAVFVYDEMIHWHRVYLFVLALCCLSS
jgi:hypothetical protein